MYDKGKKLDSKGIILACVGIIAVCIAINIAFAVFPPMGRSDGTSSEESSIGTDGASEVSGDESDDGPETDGADGQGEATHVDPSIVAVPDNLPEEATQAGFQDAVAAYLTSLTSEYGVPEKTLIESSDVNAGMGPDGSDIPYWVIRAYFPNETEIPVTVISPRARASTSGRTDLDEECARTLHNRTVPAALSPAPGRPHESGGCRPG